MKKGPWEAIASEAIIDKLEAKDIEGSEVTLTVERAFIQTIPDTKTGEVLDEFLCIEFREFPKKGLRCNKTQGAGFRALAAKGKLPSDFNDIDASFPWEGHSVPLYKKEVAFEGVKYLKLYPVAPGAFDRALVDFPRLGTSPIKPMKRQRMRVK